MFELDNLICFFLIIRVFCCKEEDSVFSCISIVSIMFWKGKPLHLFASALFSFILKPNKRHIHMSVSIHPCDPVMRFSLGHWHRAVMTSPCIKTAVCLGLCAKCFLAPSGSYELPPSLLFPALENRGDPVRACDAALPGRPACIRICMQLCGCSVVVRLCLGALRVSV